MDFFLFELLERCKEMVPDCIAKHPNLVAYHKRIAALPSIARHRDSTAFQKRRRKFCAPWASFGSGKWQSRIRTDSLLKYRRVVSNWRFQYTLNQRYYKLWDLSYCFGCLTQSVYLGESEKSRKILLENVEAIVHYWAYSYFDYLRSPV